MSDFAPPSFSLGLDFDLDSEPQTTVREEDPASKPARQSSTSARLRQIHDFGDDDYESPRIVPDAQDPDPPRALKRLRRGPTVEPASTNQKRESVEFQCNVNDEIEEFSSQEDKRRDEPPSMHNHPVYSSSKLSLPRNGILTTQSAREKKHVSNAPASANLESTNNELLFPKLTLSPLRRFQLIDSDSDSDDPSVCEGANREANKVNSSLKERESNHGEQVSSKEQARKKASVSMSQDLWNDFCSVKSVHIPTPALDEVCQEYFSSMKDKNEGQKNTKGCYQSNNVSKNCEQQLNLGHTLPPALHYYFHDDPKIQELVRSRLPNFFPLGALNNRGYKQPSASVIDYMGQFSHGEGSKKAAGKNNSEISSTRSRKKSNAGVSQGSGSWVNPRSCAENPKDAGKRRVHAVGQTDGHWYTSNGKKVYVTKGGKELTGKFAYRHYKKESGAGFKRSKKKKKSGAKKK